MCSHPRFWACRDRMWDDKIPRTRHTAVYQGLHHKAEGSDEGRKVHPAAEGSTDSLKVHVYWLNVLWLTEPHMFKLVRTLLNYHVLGTISPASRAQDFRSQGCGFESHCWQGFFILHFVAFNALLAGQPVPFKWNQAWHSSKVYRCIERMVFWKKNGGGTSS